jgi:glyoxalase family protein
MSELRTAGFHHITMVSANAARTLAFYRDVLGVGLVKRTVNFDDPGAYHLYFGDAKGSPGTLLTFFEWPHAARGRWGIGGVHHLALGTATEASQLKWKRRLTDHGVAVTGPYDRGYFTSIYFTDPDGQILEIATRGPGYAIDEPPDALGRDMRYPGGDIVVGGRDEAAIAARTHAEPVPVITPDMALEGMHHISAITNDLDRAGAFYEQALGLSLIKKTVNRDAPDVPHYFWARYEQGRVASHSALTLFGFPPRGHVSRGGVGQAHHIAFRAASGEEQLAWREHLLSLGVEVTPVLDRTYFTSIYFRAPDGLLLEIATDDPGFLIDEPAASLGSELRLPAWLEPRRDEIVATLAPLG